MTWPSYVNRFVDVIAEVNSMFTATVPFTRNLAVFVLRKAQNIGGGTFEFGTLPTGFSSPAPVVAFGGQAAGVAAQLVYDGSQPVGVYNIPFSIKIGIFVFNFTYRITLT